MRLFNTLTRQLEDFKPLNPPKVGLYSCGPTVYDYTHIGHIRTYIFVDILKRVLQYHDFKVFHVMNITDVGHLTSDADTGEDKMEKGSRREGKTVWEIAKFYTDYFFKTMEKMNIGKADVVCKATDHIKEMIELIGQLEIKGFNYRVSDGIYFDTSKLSDYGKLAGLDIEGLKEGARVEKNPEKRNPTDFALWKFSYPHGRSFASAQDDAAKRRQMEWDSPWGKGFPGWHIECSAMSMKYLGDSFDIHTGGIEHIPIHHTNEIAQSEAATGKPFVRYWLHAGHLLVEGKKMSKSAGNFYRLEEIEKKGFTPEALRYLFLTAHYRSTMSFEWEALQGAEMALEKLRERIRYWKFSKEFELPKNKKDKKKSHLDKRVQDWRDKFKEALNNDLDTPRAIAVMWKMIKEEDVRHSLPHSMRVELLEEWDKILGFGLAEISEFAIVDPQLDKLLARRSLLRKQKRWQEADGIRSQIEAKGYLLEDTAKGTRVKKTKNQKPKTQTRKY